VLVPLSDLIGLSRQVMCVLAAVAIGVGVAVGV
jgi:hypothetical protein